MELRETISLKTRTLIEVSGTGFFLLMWLAITAVEIVPPSILPSPISVVKAFGELHFNDALVRNTFYSIKLNIYGLLEAVFIAIPIGFIIGLNTYIRALVERYITVARFIPLTAVVGLFIAWFGIETNMKVQFLSFSIFLYLLPVVIQRVDDVEDVYDQTAITLGASKWQRVRHVFIPSVISRVFDDARVLSALSWTYIVVAEMVNSNGGGIGALTYVAGRQSRVDKLFGGLIVIVLIGFIQDKILIFADKFLFPHKYAKK